MKGWWIEEECEGVRIGFEEKGGGKDGGLLRWG